MLTKPQLKCRINQTKTTSIKIMTKAHLKNPSQPISGSYEAKRTWLTSIGKDFHSWGARREKRPTSICALPLELLSLEVWPSATFDDF